MITRLEIIASLYVPKKFILAVVFAAGRLALGLRNMHGPALEREPSFLETTIQFDVLRLLKRAH